jgi:hypothetical protein
MTAQGHPRAIFKRAVERGNLVIAEATAREIGRLTLEEAHAHGAGAALATFRDRARSPNRSPGDLLTRQTSLVYTALTIESFGRRYVLVR